MEADQPVHQFDPARAARFVPNSAFRKTAILLVPVDTSARTVIHAPFGEQVLEGPFYLVAAEDGSYGAVKDEFEATHSRVDATTWIKSEPVDAYRATDRCLVVTTVRDIEETQVVAEVGDWIVRQATGEVMVITPSSFAERYEAAKG